MKRKRLSPTTIVLIVFLVGALYGVSKTVTPPPPGPPPPIKVQPAPNPAVIAAEKAKYEKVQREQMVAQATRLAAIKKQPVKQIAAKTAPKQPFNPDAVDVDATYWQQHDMGATGIKQTEEQVARARAEQAAQVKKIKANEAVKKPTPRVAPQP